VQRQEDRLAAEERIKNARRAKALWLNAQPIAGTLAQRYLLARGIDLALFRHTPGALRFMAECQHIDVVGVITDWPAMLAAMCDQKGEIVAVHRTYLATDGMAKAPVAPAKKIWPTFKGAVIRISKGEKNLTPEQAAARGIAAPLLATEGIEDGLSLALACPQHRVWAAGTLGNIANIPKLPCISELIIAADNDKGPAAEHFAKVVRVLRERKFSVRITRSWQGKDANDLLKGAAA
jgi:hypothetical protein